MSTRSLTIRLGRMAVLLGLAMAVGCGPFDSESSDHVTVARAEEGRGAGGSTELELRSSPLGGSSPASNNLTETNAASSEPPADDPASSEVAWKRPGSIIRRTGISDITFDDLQLDLPAGTLFDRSRLTEPVERLDGRDVRIRGFIFAGGVFRQTGITRFPFVKNTKCKFGPQGLAYCVILVELEQGLTTDFTTYPVTVEGRLSVDPFNSGGFTWSVYRLKAKRVF